MQISKNFLPSLLLLAQIEMSPLLIHMHASLFASIKLLFPPCLQHKQDVIVLDALNLKLYCIVPSKDTVVKKGKLFVF